MLPALIKQLHNGKTLHDVSWIGSPSFAKTSTFVVLQHFAATNAVTTPSTPALANLPQIILRRLAVRIQGEGLFKLFDRFRMPVQPEGHNP